MAPSMLHRRVLVATCGLLVAEAVLAQSGDPPVAPAGTADGPPDDGMLDRFREHVDRSVAAYAAGRFAESLAATEAALTLAPPDVNPATLDFNAGACLFELGRFAEAAARFSRAADSDPELAALARLNAGFAALEGGDLAVARRYAAAVPTTDLALSERRGMLLARITAAEQRRQLDELRALLDRGFRQARSGHHAEAVATLSPDVCANPLATTRERADCHYTRALALYQLARLDAAYASAVAALACAPDDAELFLLTAEIELARGNARAADAAARRALALGLSPRDTESARAVVAAYHPLPARGTSIELHATLGYDSNAAQSGAATSTGVTTLVGRTGSPLTFVATTFGHVVRPSAQTALEPYYAVGFLGLFAPEVSELSLQSHELGTRLTIAPSSAVELRLSLAGELWLLGLDPVTPFTLDGVLEARLTTRHGARVAGRSTVEVRPTLGLDDQDYLGGVRSTVDHEESVRLGAFTPSAGVGVRWNAIGTYTASAVSLCGPPCSLPGTVYEIPLGYLAPRAKLGLSLDPTRWLRLSTVARYEWRRYEDESFIRLGGGLGGYRPLRASIKRRQDRRVELGGDVALALGPERRWSALVRYDVLLSRSNVERSADDPEHAFDYDDRSFDQHLVEVGIGTRF